MTAGKKRRVVVYLDSTGEVHRKVVSGAKDFSDLKSLLVISRCSVVSVEEITDQNHRAKVVRESRPVRRRRAHRLPAYCGSVG